MLEKAKQKVKLSLEKAGTPVGEWQPGSFWFDEAHDLAHVHMHFQEDIHVNSVKSTKCSSVKSTKRCPVKKPKRGSVKHSSKR